MFFCPSMCLFYAASILVCFILSKKSFSVPFLAGLVLVCFLRTVVESLLVCNALPWLSWWVYPNTGRERLARMAALPLTSKCGEALHWTETGRRGLLSYSARLSFRKLYPALTLYHIILFLMEKYRMVLPLIFACVYFFLTIVLSKVMKCGLKGCFLSMACVLSCLS